jgi:hypothetical protein
VREIGGVDAAGVGDDDAGELAEPAVEGVALGEQLGGEILSSDNFNGVRVG